MDTFTQYTKLLAKIADKKAELSDLNGQLDTVKATIVDTIKASGANNIPTKYGKFGLRTPKSYEYSPALVKQVEKLQGQAQQILAEAQQKVAPIAYQIKTMQEVERKEGIAKEVEGDPTLTFTKAK